MIIIAYSYRIVADAVEPGAVIVGGMTSSMEGWPVAAHSPAGHEVTGPWRVVAIVEPWRRQRDWYRAVLEVEPTDYRAVAAETATLPERRERRRL